MTKILPAFRYESKPRNNSSNIKTKRKIRSMKRQEYYYWR